MENVRFKMSFVDDSIKTVNVGRKSIASIQSGFMFTKFDNYFRQMGFKSTPEFVVDILLKNDYRLDYGKGMWITKTTGVAVCSEEDVLNDVTGRRIALMRAKRRAYERAYRVSVEIFDIVLNMVDIFSNSVDSLAEYLCAEDDAIERVIETGKSDLK